LPTICDRDIFDGVEKTKIAEQIAANIKKVRASRGWTQGELADNSSIATRTVVAAEAGDEIPTRETIVRLAYALGENIDEWLNACNYTASEREVSEIIRDSGHLHFAGEKSPELYLTELKNRLKKGPLVMVVCYNSPPGATGYPAAKNAITQAIEQGLCLAMCCPHGNTPPTTDPWTADLSLYSFQVYTSVAGYARDLSFRVSAKARRNIAVFTPNYNNRPDMALVIPPPLGLAESRPTLIYDCARSFDDPQAFELVAWFSMRQDNRNRWLRVYPAPLAKDEANAILHFRYWRNYFREILKARTADGWDPTCLETWQMDFPKGTTK
jgi:transcriptional regulator with XRE-family HTH domain